MLYEFGIKYCAEKVNEWDSFSALTEFMIYGGHG